MTTNASLIALSIALLAAVAAAPSSASAQNAQDAQSAEAGPSPELTLAPQARESPVWFGFGVGVFSLEAHLGLRDLFAEDASLRLDAFASLLPVTGNRAFGGAVHALWTPSSDGHLRGYMGGGLELSYTEPLFQFCIWACEPPPTGTYLGGTAVMGFEAGGRSNRFFAEIGISVSGLVSGDGQAPTVDRPRFVIGMSFL